MQKPLRLSIGDTIAIVALSSCGGFLFPHRLERGKEALKALGFKVVEYPCVMKNVDGSAGTAEERAEDLHRAFADDNIRAIIAGIGGITLNEVLPLLDYELIAKHPKIFCGYSDNTLLHCALTTKAKLISFYGPCVLTQFAEYPEPLKYTVDHFLGTLMQTDARNVTPSGAWTDEILDWFQKEDLSRARKLTSNVDGNRWLRQGQATAPVIGGCLYSLLQVKGTEFDLDYKDKLLFLDFPESESNFAVGQSLSYVSSQLADLALAGVLSKIRGLIVGRGFGYNEEQHKELFKIIERQTKKYDFPIIVNVNIGHADPITTVPLGVTALLDSETDTFRLLEGGVS